MFHLLYGTKISRAKKKPTKKVREFAVTKYMQRPPTIMPNYGKLCTTKLGQPKTSMSRVLLYDNVTQQQLLDVKLAHIKIEKERSVRMLELHKRSFTTRIAKRRQSLQNMAPVRLPPINRNRKSAEANIAKMYSSLSLSDVALSKIPEHHEKEILLRVQTKSGKKKIYHSFDEKGLFQDVVPLFLFYPKVTEDPRFHGLEMTLHVPPLDETDHQNDQSESKTE